MPELILTHHARNLHALRYTEDQAIRTLIDVHDCTEAEAREATQQISDEIAEKFIDC